MNVLRSSGNKNSTPINAKSVPSPYLKCAILLHIHMSPQIHPRSPILVSAGRRYMSSCDFGTTGRSTIGMAVEEYVSTNNFRVSCEFGDIESIGWSFKNSFRAISFSVYSSSSSSVAAASNNVGWRLERSPCENGGVSVLSDTFRFWE